MENKVTRLITDYEGKTLTGIYFPKLTDESILEEYRKIHINGGYSSEFFFEMDSELFWVNNAFIFYKDEKQLSENEKKDMFCANELFSDYIGRKIISVTYSVELLEYRPALVPFHKISIQLENDATITLQDLKYWDRVDGIDLVKIHLSLSSKYRSLLIRTVIDEGMLIDDMLEMSNPMASMKESEKEEYARKLLVERGIIT